MPVKIQIALVAIIVASIAGCSSHRMSVKFKAKKIAFLNEIYSADKYTGEQYVTKLDQAYRELLASEVQSERLRRVDADSLTALFDTLNTIGFYSPRLQYSYDLEKIINELFARGQHQPYQIRRLHERFINVRLFDQAKELAGRFPQLDLEQVPPTEGKVKNDSAPRVYEVSPEGNSLKIKSITVGQGPRIVAVTHPLCGFSRKAIKAIEHDDVLRPIFEQYAVLISPPGGSLEMQPTAEWNRQHPALPVHLIYRIDDWPQVDRWLATPTFYFLLNGKVMHRAASWPSDEARVNLLNGLRKIGLLT